MGVGNYGIDARPRFLGPSKPSEHTDLHDDGAERQRAPTASRRAGVARLMPPAGLFNALN